ncbi:MAG TPA: peptidase M50 [Desulfotomaculum sp.]|nr:peptidase M50 [Desulfotomaculum sp.]
MGVPSSRAAFRVHPLFLALLMLCFAAGVFDRAVAAFGAVLLHELGHVAAAHSVGAKVSRIELFPFGGVARLEGMGTLSPLQEITVALAGPLTSLALFCVGLGFMHFGYLTSGTGQFFLTANLMLAVFNLLPGLPLDGGRILRAWLAGKQGWGAGTLAAATAGQFIGLATIALGVLGPVLGRWGLDAAALGFFIFYAATREKRYIPYLFVQHLAAKEQELLSRQVLPGSVLVATKNARLLQVARLFHPGRFHLIAVINAGSGEYRLLSEREVVEALTTSSAGASIGNLINEREN